MGLEAPRQPCSQEWIRYPLEGVQPVAADIEPGDRMPGVLLTDYPLCHSPLTRWQLLAQIYGFCRLPYDQNQLGSDDLSGKVKLKVEPLPTSLSTQIFPPCSSTNFLAKVSPSPVPSLL
jgi:hypothetical protein